MWISISIRRAGGMRRRRKPSPECGAGGLTRRRKRVMAQRGAEGWVLPRGALSKIYRFTRLATPFADLPAQNGSADPPRSARPVPQKDARAPFHVVLKCLSAGSPVCGGPPPPPHRNPHAKVTLWHARTDGNPAARVFAPAARPPPQNHSFIDGKTISTLFLLRSISRKAPGVPQETSTSPPRRLLPRLYSWNWTRLYGGVHCPLRPGSFRLRSIGRWPAYGRIRAASWPVSLSNTASRLPCPAWPPQRNHAMQGARRAVLRTASR